MTKVGPDLDAKIHRGSSFAREATSKQLSGPAKASDITKLALGNKTSSGQFDYSPEVPSGLSLVYASTAGPVYPPRILHWNYFRSYCVPRRYP